MDHILLNGSKETLGVEIRQEIPLTDEKSFTTLVPISRMGKGENLGLNKSQGWEEEKTKGRIITKSGQKKKPRAE